MLLSMGVLLPQSDKVCLSKYLLSISFTYSVLHDGAWTELRKAVRSSACIRLGVSDRIWCILSPTHDFNSIFSDVRESIAAISSDNCFSTIVHF